LNLPANGLVLGTNQLVASGGSVGVGTATPHASAALDVYSTTKGFLPPRMTSAERLAIASPIAGLIVFDTTEERPYTFRSGSWVKLADTTEVSFSVSLTGDQALVSGATA